MARRTWACSSSLSPWARNTERIAAIINRVTIRMDKVDTLTSNNRPSRDVLPRALSVGASGRAMKREPLTANAAHKPLRAWVNLFLRPIGDAWDLDLGLTLPRVT